MIGLRAIVYKIRLLRNFNKTEVAKSAERVPAPRQFLTYQPQPETASWQASAVEIRISKTGKFRSRIGPRAFRRECEELDVVV
uniref:Transposase n=1 Tax=Mesocestoides corti TaxID=53468 RepID=A0A5K3EGM6_MESCO